MRPKTVYHSRLKDWFPRITGRVGRGGLHHGKGDDITMGSGLFITFLPEETTGEVSEGETILEAAERLGVALNHECGGVASCSTCRVQISGVAALSPVDVDEREVLDREQLDAGYRLACQARIKGPITVVIPPTVTPLADQAIPQIRP